MSKIIEIPAFVDLHVHFREPGFTEKETIETGIIAAFRGGYEIVCAMPNTKPCADNPDIVSFIRKEGNKNPAVKLFPIGAVTKNLTSSELTDFEALKKAGAIAFSNDGMPISDRNVFKKALMTGELICSHLEDEPNEVLWQIDLFKEVQKLADKGLSKSPRLHFCHISTKSALEAIKGAKKEGFNLTAETAPHYFTFTKNDRTSDGVFKMNPPLRENADREAVIEALKDGTLDIIATDHAPHTNEEKLKPYNEAPNGITGLETAFPLALMVLTLDEIVEKMSLAPSRILGIKTARKIKVDLEKEWVIKSAEFQSKCKVSPYDKMEVKGKVLCE